MQPYLIPCLPFGPAILLRLLPAIPEGAWDAPTHPGRFTPREVVAHLADWEPILQGRMRQAVESPGSAVQGIDEGRRAEEQDYGSTDWRAEAERFAVARRETAEWLAGRAEDDWDRFVVHNERGRQTLYDQANLLLGHDLYHIEQLTAVARL